MARHYNNSTVPCFEAYVDARGEWRWTYYASNGEEIGVSSEGYRSRAGCERSIELMRQSGSAAVTVWWPKT